MQQTLSFGIRRLRPVLSEFMELHPQLRVLLHLDDGYRDIISEGLDVAIRIGELKESTLIAQRITNVRRYLGATPDYLARKGVFHRLPSISQITPACTTTIFCCVACGFSSG